MMGDVRFARSVAQVVAQGLAFVPFPAAQRLSADEQLRNDDGVDRPLAASALLLRLFDGDDPAAKPVFFVAATKSPSDDRACDRAAYSCFSFWRDQAQAAMRRVARSYPAGC